MSPEWLAEIRAVFAKELRSELRARAGLMAATLFGVCTVSTISFASWGRSLDGQEGVAASLLWAALIFSSVVALPRAFLAEEEGGTADLLRLVARPHAVFWGKALFNLVLMGLTALTLSGLFFLLSDISVSRPWLYLVVIGGGCIALAGSVTLCGALVAQAASRAALVGAIALPLLLPLTFLGVQGMREALGDPGTDGNAREAVGLVGYAALTWATGPYLFAAVWKS